jgi:hypothetical protein
VRDLAPGDDRRIHPCQTPIYEASIKISAWQSIRSLESVGAHILGTVTNNLKASKVYYNYDYMYR